MSEKCVKCGQPLPDNASFCPHCTAVQTEKQEIKAPKRWRKAAVSATAVMVLLAADCEQLFPSIIVPSPMKAAHRWFIRIKEDHIKCC